jgi:zinc protease
MGYLLPALTDAKFRNQREVVLNERRQNYENRPYGLAGMAASASLFAPDHPYHWLTIGSADDLRAASLDEVHAFFRAYYHPANASLALAGNVDADAAFDLAERYFGELEPGPAVAPVSAAGALDAERRVVIEDRVELPRLYLSWHAPAIFADGDADLDLASDAIAHGKTSRLYNRLVYERRIATDVTAYQHSRELSGVFQLVATAVPGVPLAELDAVITSTIAELASEGPTEPELERALAQTEAHFVFRVQTIGGFGGKSDQLNAYNVFNGTPGLFDVDRQRYYAATRDSIAAATRRWLVEQPRVALSVVPRGQRGLALEGSVGVEVS